MKRFFGLFLACWLCSGAPAWAQQQTIEFLKADITPDNVRYLTGAACRNFDWIVHLDINVNWPREKLDHVGGASDYGLVIKAHDEYYNIEFNIYTNEQPDLEKPSHINGYYFVKNDTGSTGNWSISMYPLKHNPNLPEVKRMESECSPRANGQVAPLPIIKTDIRDADELQILKDGHLIAVSSIVPDEYKTESFGDVYIMKENGIYQLSGSQNCNYLLPNDPTVAQENSIMLDGQVREVFTNGFTFDGAINAKRVSEMPDGEHLSDLLKDECSLTGTFDFTREGHPDFWRITGTKGTCLEGKYEDIRIFTSPFKGIPPNPHCGWSRYKSRRQSHASKSD